MKETKKNLFLISQKAFIFKNKKLLVLKNSNDLHGGISQYELPGGILNFDEDILDALKREVQEETGLEIKSAKIWTLWKKQTSFQEMSQIKDASLLGVGYRCSVFPGTIRLSREHKEFLWAEKSLLSTLDFSHNSKVAVQWYLSQNN